MKQIFEQLLQLLQQGVAAIVRFVQLIWTWTAEQISKVAQVPWDSWPLWKQILLVIVAAAVAYLLFVAARQLWAAGLRVLTAFGSLLLAFVVTLPTILVAGVVALGGLWAINNVNNLSLPTLTFERGNTGSPSDNGQQSDKTTGQR
jgi:cytochrome bd-type quinol oxidase subunit 2